MVLRLRPAAGFVAGVAVGGGMVSFFITGKFFGAEWWDGLTAVGTVGATVSALWWALHDKRAARKKLLIDRYVFCLKLQSIIDYVAYQYGFEEAAVNFDMAQYEAHLAMLQKLYESVDDPARLYWVIETRKSLVSLLSIRSFGSWKTGPAVPEHRAKLKALHAHLEQWRQECEQVLKTKYGFVYPFDGLPVSAALGGSVGSQ
ncbi:hypothetical protein [Kerstersia sp.]|uniref:hypothetical protein n=1 Tax=Kerstersia sp. TaxID=1930783 RepID=UPI003F92F848